LFFSSLRSSFYPFDPDRASLCPGLIVVPAGSPFLVRLPPAITRNSIFFSFAEWTYHVDSRPSCVLRASGIEGVVRIPYSKHFSLSGDLFFFTPFFCFSPDPLYSDRPNLIMVSFQCHFFLFRERVLLSLSHPITRYSSYTCRQVRTDRYDFHLFEKLMSLQEL